MKLPWSVRWRLWASFFHEFVVESASSEYNPELYVTLRNGRFILHTPKAIYSYEDKYSNFARAIKEIGPSEFDDADVLLLGLGLASIPMIFEKKHGLELDFTAVEIDPVVIGLCQKYAAPLLKSNMQIFQADAFAYVRQKPSTFDAIMMDVFLDDVIPQNYRAEVFLQCIDDMLNPEGWFLYNMLYSTTEDQQKADQYFEDVFQSTFASAKKLKVDRNVIFIYNKK